MPSSYHRRSILCKCVIAAAAAAATYKWNAILVQSAVSVVLLFIESASFVVNEMTSPKVKTVRNGDAHMRLDEGELYAHAEIQLILKTHSDE